MLEIDIWKKLHAIPQIVTMPKVLVVDDDKDIMEVVSVILSHGGFEVEKVLKGRDVMKCLQTSNPDVILLDVNIVDADGREICKQLKSAQSLYKDVPVILFSAMHDLQHNYPECMANDYIAKPFDSRELIRKVRQHATAA